MFTYSSRSQFQEPCVTFKVIWKSCVVYSSFQFYAAFIHHSIKALCVCTKQNKDKQTNKQAKKKPSDFFTFFQQIFKSTQKVNNYIIWFLSLRNLKSRRISTHTKYLNEYFLKGKEVVKCHGKGVLFC